MTTISYAITACDEHEDLERLLGLLRHHIRPKDEIVLQLDDAATEEVRRAAQRYGMGTGHSYRWAFHPLNKDFASFKNHVAGLCTGDVVFHIDADEQPHPELVVNLPAVLDDSPEIDVFLVARINTVEGLTAEHVDAWGWRFDGGRVNFPDYQWRIWRTGRGIRWRNRVHERLDGFRSYKYLPHADEWCLYHSKGIGRQERQNAWYRTFS